MKTYATPDGMLVTQSGVHAGQRHLMPQAPGALTIGRDPTCDIAFDPERERIVGKLHARIEVRMDGGVYLVDLKARNGTFVNGSPLTGEVRLCFGDRILLGDGGPELVVEFAPLRGEVLTMAGGELPSGTSQAVRTVVLGAQNPGADALRDSSRSTTPAVSPTGTVVLTPTVRLGLQDVGSTMLLSGPDSAGAVTQVLPRRMPGTPIDHTAAAPAPWEGRETTQSAAARTLIRDRPATETLRPDPLHGGAPPAENLYGTQPIPTRPHPVEQTGLSTDIRNIEKQEHRPPLGKIAPPAQERIARRQLAIQFAVIACGLLVACGVGLVWAGVFTQP